MAKSIKLKNNTYLDASSIIFRTPSGRYSLEELLNMWYCKPPTNNDFNRAYKTGLYLWDRNSLNAPLTGNNYGIVICFTSYGYEYNQQNNWLFQIAIRTHINDGVWLRRKINSDPWESWKYIS